MPPVSETTPPVTALTGVLMGDLPYRATGAAELFNAEGTTLHRVAAVFNDRWPDGWRKGQGVVLTEADDWGTHRIEREWRPGNLYSWARALENIEHKGRGQVAILDAATRETGETETVLACACGVQEGQVIDLHDCCGRGEWHVAGIDADQTFEALPAGER